MKNKLTIIVAICVSIALVGGLFFWVSSTNNQNKYTYDYQVSKQALSAEKRLKSPNKGQIDIYIAFKRPALFVKNKRRQLLKQLRNYLKM